jgi:hypothetical protein
VAIDGKEIDLTGLRPIDLMLAALAYGIGIRYIDKTGKPYEIECEVDGYNVTCRVKCIGEEEKCLIYQTLTKGLLKHLCTKE